MRIGLATLASCAVLALVLTTIAEATTTSTRISGSDYGLACPTRTLCYTLDNSSSQAAVITLKGHKESRRQPVTKARYLYNVSCANQHFCLAAGTTTSDHGVLVEVRDGTVGQTAVLPWIPEFVACPAVDRCLIAGSARHVSAVEVALVSGTKVKAEHKHAFAASASGISVEALSCASASACELIVETEPSSGPHDYFESVGAGAKPGHPHFGSVFNTVSGVGLACPPRQHTCYLTGMNQGFSTNALYSVRIGGASLTHVSTYNGTLYRLACFTLAHCTGAGDSSSGSGTVVIPFLHGHPGHPQSFSMPQLVSGGGFRAVAMSSATTWTAIGGSGSSSKTTLVRGTTP